MEKSKVEDKVLPNQGVIQTLENSIRMGGIVGIVVGLLGGLIGWLVGGVSEGIIGFMGGLCGGAVIGALSAGLGDVIKHYCLRFTLYRAGKSPLDYPRFLEYASSHRFILRIGGRYRFMHERLKQYFSDLACL